MAGSAETALREELRRAGLPAEGALPRLLGLLRASAETHLDDAAAQRLAAEAGIALGRSETVALLEALVAAGLLGRVPSLGPGPVYDTVTRPHSHLLQEPGGPMVDLEVSPETLAAIVTRAIAENPGRVEVLLRIRPPDPAPAGPRRRGRPPGARRPAPV